AAPEDRMPRLALVFVCVAVGPAFAQDEFRPAVDSRGYLTLNSSQVLDRGELSFGLGSLAWGRHPDTAVDHIVTATLVGTVGVRGRRLRVRWRTPGDQRRPTGNRDGHGGSGRRGRRVCAGAGAVRDRRRGIWVFAWADRSNRGREAVFGEEFVPVARRWPRN